MFLFGWSSGLISFQLSVASEPTRSNLSSVVSKRLGIVCPHLNDLYCIIQALKSVRAPTSRHIQIHLIIEAVTVMFTKDSVEALTPQNRTVSIVQNR